MRNRYVAAFAFLFLCILVAVGIVKECRYSIYMRESARLIQKAAHINHGMSEQGVIELLGVPDKRLWVSMGEVKNELASSELYNDRLRQLENKYERLYKYWYSVSWRTNSVSVAIYFDRDGGSVVLITNFSFFTEIPMKNMTMMTCPLALCQP